MRFGSRYDLSRTPTLEALALEAPRPRGASDVLVPAARITHAGACDVRRRASAKGLVGKQPQHIRKRRLRLVEEHQERVPEDVLRCSRFENSNFSIQLLLSKVAGVRCETQLSGLLDIRGQHPVIEQLHQQTV